MGNNVIRKPRIAPLYQAMLVEPDMDFLCLLIAFDTLVSVRSSSSLPKLLKVVKRLYKAVKSKNKPNKDGEAGSFLLIAAGDWHKDFLISKGN